MTKQTSVRSGAGRATPRSCGQEAGRSHRPERSRFAPFIVSLAAALSACGGDEAAFAPGETHVTAAGHELFEDTGDLERIRERGTLRVLVPSTEEAFLPRRGSPRAVDRELVRSFAQANELDIQFILVPEHGRLLRMLRRGLGDVAAAQLTVTESRSQVVDFTWPLASADEILVGQAGTEDLPRTVEELNGREVHVRGGSSYFETLQAIVANEAPGLEIVPVPEEVDTETIVYQVSVGVRPLTVVDSHLLEDIEAYNDGIERLATLEEGRQIAWAVRVVNPDLRSALDAFLVERALLPETEERFTGDLDGIRERGVLRVLTRNNAVTYFLHRGQPEGFDYTLARMLADSLGVRLEMVVPPSRDLLIPWLLEGRGDVIAASMTVTPERAEQVAFSEPYMHVDEFLVGPAEGPRYERVQDLAGAQVHVRPQSSYYETLRELELDVEVVEAPQEMETEQLIGQVARGEIPLTVADGHILQVERTYRDDIEPLFALTGELGEEMPDPARIGLEGQRAIGFAVRPDAVELLGAIDRFVEDAHRSTDYNVARERYFQQRRTARVGSGVDEAEDGRLSPYDGLIQRYAGQYGFDWRFMAALAYQESQFDPQARSWAGAVGLFQLMPSTARALGFENLMDPEASIHAGTLYLHSHMTRLEPGLPFEERLRFALASYNAGRGHLEDARRLAVEKGLDPDAWFENVEEAMLLLMQPEYYRRARNGYVRGSEPVAYVAQIEDRYSTYVQILPPM